MAPWGLYLSMPRKQETIAGRRRRRRSRFEIAGVKKGEAVVEGGGNCCETSEGAGAVVAQPMQRRVRGRRG